MGSICVLGNFVADNSFYANKLPSKGQTLFGTGYQVGPGGKGSNQAVSASRLGSKVYFLGKIGDDENGKMALDLYKKDKINTETVIVSKEYPTGVAGILINTSDGSNSIIVYPGASMEITKDEVNSFSKFITNSKIFLTQLEVPKDVTLHCLKIAKESGCLTILNPAPASEITKEFYSNIDYFTPNETEAEFYTGIKINDEKDAKNSAKKLLNMGIKKVIITLGEKGLFYSDGKEEIYIKASPVKAVDTTGAGDAFNGSFSFALLKGKKIRECLEFANKFAGLSTTKLGAGDSMPFLKI